MTRRFWERAPERLHCLRSTRGVLLRECSAVAVRPGGSRTFPNSPLGTAARRLPSAGGRRIGTPALGQGVAPVHAPDAAYAAATARSKRKKSLGVEAGSPSIAEAAAAAAGAFIFPPPFPPSFRVMYYVDCGGIAVERYMVCMRPNAPRSPRFFLASRAARVPASCVRAARAPTGPAMSVGVDRPTVKLASAPSVAPTMDSSKCRVRTRHGRPQAVVKPPVAQDVRLYSHSQLK